MARALTKSKRFNEIFHILLEHRFPSLLREMGALRPPEEEEELAKPIGRNGAKPQPEVRVRRLLEDLGPTFIKIGQLLGTRPDLIPKQYVEEFKKLYDATPPTPFPDVKRLVESELRRPLDQVFRSFSETPIASASIAQVHRATLLSGEVVAVKAQHPGIEERMRLDFEMLRWILQFAERVFAATQVWQPTKHLEEVRRMLDLELDFRYEGQVSLQVEENFKDFPEVKIPHVFRDLSTRRLLVMEFVDGAKFNDRARLNLAREDGANLARIITHAMARQIFVDRLFHADPSPGNILLIGRDKVCFLDFGAVGQVTKRRSRLIYDFITQMYAGNLDETARVIVEMCEIRREYDSKRFLFDLERILDYYETRRVSPADPVLLDMIIHLANTHGMLLPSDFMLITRALYQFDGMCKLLDPDYELGRVLMPFIHQTLRERIFGGALQTEQLAVAAGDMAKMLARLPGHVEQILVKAEKGLLTGRVDFPGLAAHQRHTASLQFFLGFTLILSAALVGTTFGYVFAGLDGFAVAGSVSILGLLLWTAVYVIARYSLRPRR